MGKNYFIFGLILILLNLSFISAQSFGVSSSGASFYNVQYVAPNFQTYYGDRVGEYWPILKESEQECKDRQDFLLMTAPAGCQPAVVRSDLLADQNVPVFCQIEALQVNPLLNLKSIENIRFSNTNYPKEVANIGFHPARAALATRDRLLGSPLINNIGYVVVVLKKNPKESELPDYVNLTLNGKVEFNAGNVFGVGKNEFILKKVRDEDWDYEKERQSFWQGRFYIRLNDFNNKVASISIYEKDKKIATRNVELGKSSDYIYLPGFYCSAKLQLSYLSYESKEPSARIEISDEAGVDKIDVYKDSTFLDGKCRVLDLNVSGEDIGNITISCGSEKFSLSLGLLLKGEQVGNTLRKLYDSEKNIVEKKDVSLGGVVFKDLSVKNINGLHTVIHPTDQSVWQFEGNSWVKKEEKLVIKEDSIKVEGFESLFKDAIDASKKVSFEFPYEKVSPEAGDKSELYGEIALRQAIQIADKFNKTLTKAELIKILLEKYPTSPFYDEYSRELSKIYKFDNSLSSYFILSEGRYKQIRVISFSPGKIPKGIFDFGMKRVELIQGVSTVVDKFRDSQGKERNITIRLDRFKDADNVATVYVDCGGVISSASLAGGRQAKSGSIELKKGENGELVCNNVVLKYVDSTNEKVARIRINPPEKNLEVSTNLTIKIGIEKRAIQLAPDKIIQKIKNLNESINKWEKISNSLAKIVTGLKGACFATSAVLTIKNFATGLSGEALARQQVMRGENGWVDYCKKNLANYNSLDDCFLKNAGKINADVDKRKQAIESVNADIKSIEQRNKQGGSSFLFDEASINTEQAKKELATVVRQKYGEEEIDIVSGTKLEGKEKVKVKELLDDKNLDALSYTEIRDIYMNLEARKKGLSDVGSLSANKELSNSADRIARNIQFYKDTQSSKNLEDLGLGPPIFTGPQTQSDRMGVVVPVTENIRQRAGFSSTISHVSLISAPPSSQITRQGSGSNQNKNIEGGLYLAGLEEVEGKNGYYVIKEIKRYKDGNYLDLENGLSVAEFNSRNGIGYIRAADRQNYHNKYLNPEVRYYETEPFKGMPAVVPFDTVNGWYAGVKQTLPFMNKIGSYDASGMVKSFWLCNVGSNGREQFDEAGFGDDICQQINLNTGQPLNLFPGLDSNTAKMLIDDAINAIEQAARQFGQPRVNIVTRTGGRVNLKAGRPFASVPETQCQDFMSPEDCYILFNVCDPVICPSSRCDLGGKYPVSNVIQTGIIGGIFLCLPNIREGIVIPLCLSGIQAGIDSYLSILKSHRDCLQANLDNGQMIGICDQIYSIYVCEFFWREVAPIANIILPKLVELAYGQGGTRGGGEYLTVMGAWQNAQKSIEYFTQTYAVNSLKAFQIKSVEDVGTEFCKAFISMKGPKSLKSLVEPDSPPQFYASFDSIPYSSATIPATSQYKVFYHIFAGKDAGVYYSVYLKNPPQSSYFYSTERVFVASGFISKGEYKSETKDFTAPEGYKELCVRINNEEKCGFKQVSTDFAVNYVRDMYVADQMKDKSIKTEEECVSGRPGAGSLFVNSNPQAAVEEAISPKIYNRGIVRICSKANPGSSVDPARFEAVGYCGSTQIICWLDKKSVQNAVTENNLGVKEEVTKELNKSIYEKLETGQFMTFEEAKAELESIDKAIEENKDWNNQEKILQINERIDFVYPKLILNSDKAMALYLKAKLKIKILEKKYLPIYLSKK